jgi:AcrR family transcriptional regulator
MKSTMMTKKIGRGAAKKSTGCRRNADTSRAIVDAASRLLQEKGYAGFTIEEVARRSGASKSTIYRWWSSKMHLLFDIYGGEVERTLVIPDFGNIEAEIIFLTRAIWRFWRETPSGQAYRSMIAEAQSDPTAIEQWRSRFLPERRRKLLFTLQRAADRGELRPDINLKTVVDILFGFSWYRLLTGQIDDNVKAITAMVREVVQGILHKNTP